jgi:Leu/Phe-tRNA-protein transferase
MLLHYTADGFLVILPHDDPQRIVDAMLETGYSEEFCIALNFRADFVARLMKAGFLVMSLKLSAPEESEDSSGDATSDGYFVLLPKLHLVRSVLFFDKLHIKNSIKRYLCRTDDPYELYFDADFDYIVDRCIAVHGDDWLTPPLVDAIKTIRQNRPHGVYPASFALYRDGKLVAGEFGVIAGRVYTSYSGYYDESNAGTVQLILTARYLEEHGFAFFDLGMPLDYKTALGATDVSPREFVELFRAARERAMK